MFLVVTVAFLVAVTTADISETKCPQLNPDYKFNISQIGTGQLFDIARYNEDLVEKMGDCAVGTYELNGETADFQMSFIENKKQLFVKGLVRYNNDTQELIFTFSENGKVKLEMRFNVIYTDHKNLFMIYNCNYDNAVNTKNEMFWILSRCPEPDSDTQAQIDKFFESNSFIDTNKIKWANFSHESCAAQSE